MKLLRPVEVFLIAAIAAIAAADTVLIVWRGVQVDGPAYLAGIAIGVTAIMAGLGYRHWRREEGISLATISAGLFILYTIAASVFNYLLIPGLSDRIDPMLMEIDSHTGYDWRAYVAWFAEQPLLVSILGAVYTSSLLQLIVMILILGFSRDPENLNRFLLTGIIGSFAAICFWYFFPSSGPAAYVDLGDIWPDASTLVVGNGYGAELNRLFAEGIAVLTPKDTLGLIAFPSFHTVMALMSVWFVPRRLYLLVPTIAVNALMVPAILLHGGHHLVDVAGGVVTFFLAAWAADNICIRFSSASRIASGAVHVAPTMN